MNVLFDLGEAMADLSAKKASLALSIRWKIKTYIG